MQATTRRLLVVSATSCARRHPIRDVWLTPESKHGLKNSTAFSSSGCDCIHRRGDFVSGLCGLVRLGLDRHHQAGSMVKAPNIGRAFGPIFHLPHRVLLAGGSRLGLGHFGRHFPLEAAAFKPINTSELHPTSRRSCPITNESR